MIASRQRRWTWIVAALSVFPRAAVAQNAESFRAVLTSSGLGPEVLIDLSDGPDYPQDDWRILLQVFNRLEQFYDLQPTTEPISELPESWQSGDEVSIGDLYEIRGKIVALTEVVLPENLSEIHEGRGIYRCKFEFSAAQSGAWRI